MVSIVKMFCAPYVFVIVLSLVGKLILVAFEKPCAFQLFDWEKLFVIVTLVMLCKLEPMLKFYTASLNMALGFQKNPSSPLKKQLKSSSLF